jgi:CRP-like cAMP-binding protein
VADPVVDVLAGTALFSGLPLASLREAAAAARVRTIEPGHVVFREGDPAAAVFVGQRGSIKLTQVGPDGHQVVLRLLGPGDVFGGAAAIGDETYPVTAEAVDAVTVFEWQGPVMAGLMERHARLAVNVLRVVASRLHALQVQYRQMATEHVERRVARALLRLVQHAGRRVENGVLIDLPLSREDIAQMTGTTLFTVSRIISRWESIGLIEAGRQRIVIRVPHGLVSIAEELA